MCIHIYNMIYIYKFKQLDYNIYIYYRNMDTAYIVVVYMYDIYMY